MSSKYWIKLYHEILDDPKMGMLSDNLWRRTIELFLLAGELSIDTPEDDRGRLPYTQELAWRLRRSAQELEQELEQLARINIVTKTETGWIVTKFAERQKAVPAIERMRQLRERKQKEDKSVTQDKDIVTRSVTKSNIDIESDKDIEKEKKPAPTALTKISPGPVCQALLGICKLDWDYAKDDPKLQTDIKKITAFLAKKDAQPNDIKEFETWRQAHHWTGKDSSSSPTLKQVGEFWGQYEEWVKMGRPAPQPKNGTGAYTPKLTQVSDGVKSLIAKLDAESKSQIYNPLGG